MKKLFLFITFIAFLTLLFIGGVKGYANDLNYYDKTQDTRIGGPYEASNSTSRYALTQAIVDNNSVSFTEKQAAFATPDVALSHDKYYTIFTPGISFFGAPFYYLGEKIGFPQVTTYMLTVVFGVINGVLILLILKKLSVDTRLSALSALVFLFGSNAFAYAFTYTQHHISTAFLLISVLLALSKRTVLSNILLGLVYGLSITADIPNAFLLLPSLLYAFGQQFDFQKVAEKLKVSIKLNVIAIAIGLLPVIFLIGKYNLVSTGSPTTLMQFVGRVDYVSPEKRAVQVAKPVTIKPEDKKLPFDTRLMLDGAKTLITSNERGWLYYSPVLLLGIVGLILLYKNKALTGISVLLSSVVALNVLLYSMFGDPWGGWSFGPRYLIPAAAIMAIANGYALYVLRNKILFTILFIFLFLYSVYINITGGLTTTTVPPKQEAEALKTNISYTYHRNFELVEKNQSGSYVYNSYLQDHLSLSAYISLYTGSLMVVALLLLKNNLLLKERKSYEII